MAELTRYWKDRMPSFPAESALPVPLTRRKMLTRDETYTHCSGVRWEQLLAGDREDRPCLSISETEHRFLRSDSFRDLGPLRITRRWDVDSLIARATTLAAFRGGFQLSYSPSFLRRIVQNPYVRFEGHAIQKLKQLRLGFGLASGGYDYHCHVFFPNMDETQETHLDHRHQQLWIDEIVLPALRHSCEADILQHHPRSHADAYLKAGGRKERHPHKSDPAHHTGFMDIHFPVPEPSLARFWDEIVRRCNRRREWQHPFLVISGHGLKLWTKASDALHCRESYVAHLDRCFRMEHLPARDCWLDFGVEDTPAGAGDGGAPPAVTLLRKAPCLREWAGSFSCPSSVSALTRTVDYTWALTRDAGSATTELYPTNDLREKGGIAYNKAYNLHKDVFAIPPLHGHSPFGNHQLEALGYSQSLIDRWYRTNRGGGGAPSYPDKRNQLKAAEQHTKERIHTGLEAAARTSFGVRQEYRIDLTLFQSLDLTDEPHVETVECETSKNENDRSGTSTRDQRDAETHRPYFILPTAEVVEYEKYDINRYLLLLEFLASTAESAPGGVEALSHEQQSLNGVMVSALRQALNLSVGGGNPCLSWALWLDHWKPKAGRRPRGRSAESQTSTSRRRRIGLNLKDSVQRTGLAWFPRDLIAWEGIPTFRSSVVNRLAFLTNGLQRTLRTRRIQTKLTEEDRLLALLRRKLQAIRQPSPPGSTREDDLRGVMSIGAQLCVQAYIQDVIKKLVERVEDPPPDHPALDVDPSLRRAAIARYRWKEVTGDLSEDDAKGLGGLTYGMICLMLKQEPHVVETRQARANGRARNGRLHFESYNTGSWMRKVQGLFEWDDGTARKWHREHFREVTRTVHGMFVQELGAEIGPRFKRRLALLSARHLLIVPQYDVDKFMVERKPHEYRSKDEVPPKLQRFKWLVAQLHREHLHEPMDRLFVKCGRAPRGQLRLTPQEQTDRKAIRLAMMNTASLQVMRSASRATGLLKHSEFYRVPTRLEDVADFYIELAVDRDQDSTEDDAENSSDDDDDDEDEEEEAGAESLPLHS